MMMEAADHIIRHILPQTASYVLVALLNHPRAGEGREVLNAALRWTAQQADAQP